MRHLFLPLFVLLLCILFSSCHKDQDMAGVGPKIKEQSVEVLATQATFKWTVDYPGKISSMVEISLNEDMSDAVRFGSEVETSEKRFCAVANNLKEGTTYYYRYVIWNRMAEYNLEVKHFITYAKPTVTTMGVANIEWRTATCSGEVIFDGGATVTERGVCWSTGHNPEITDNHAVDDTGVRNFSVDMKGLTAGMTYYVRAYATNQAGVGYGNEVSFKSKEPELPKVTTGDVTDISWAMAKGSGDVTSDGGVEVIERGVCWSTGHYPVITDGHAADSTGLGSYTVDIAGLTAETTYYVRAYATNSEGVNYGEEMSFETPALQKPTVTTSPISSITLTSAVGGGEVTCDGGTIVTERGICYGISPNPSVTGIKLAASSEGMGSFTCAMANLDANTTYYVCAYATNNQGTNYGVEVCFTPHPIGAISGLFSVSAEGQVYFSQGNLQYRASDGQWRFALHQYDCIGSYNSNISSSYGGWIDLFGWGTSGYNGKNPYMTSTTPTDYGDSGNSSIAFTNYDWGLYNAISNGDNETGMWFTLTKSQWLYVFVTRNTSSGINFAKACVNSVNGVILLPDDWSASTFSLSATNSIWASFSTNTINATQWITLEDAGAVFLPAAGYRYGTSVYCVGSDGYYWSSSSINNNTAYRAWFDDSDLVLYYGNNRYSGLSVRLVRLAQ